MELAQAIRERAEALYPEQIDMLRRFAGIDCGTGDEEGNRRAAAIVSDYLRDMGARCENVCCPGVGIHVVGRIRPQSPSGKLIISAHLDTVFRPGDAAKHPYRERDGWGWGLGVADCKGGVVCSATAVRIMAELGALPDKEIVMLYTCDEETGSHTGRELFRRESEGAESAFVFEPARNQNGIITERQGLALLRFFAVGRRAHAALDYRSGVSATQQIAGIVRALDGLGAERPGLHYNVGRMGGDDSSLVVAGQAWCEAAVSLPEADSLAAVQEDMARAASMQFVQGCTVRPELDVLFPRQERTQQVEALYRRVRDAGQRIGLALPEERSDGPSDAGFFSSFGVPVVDGLGPYMKDIHTVDERVLLRTVRERTELFCMVLDSYS